MANFVKSVSLYALRACLVGYFWVLFTYFMGKKSKLLKNIGNGLPIFGNALPKIFGNLDERPPEKISSAELISKHINPYPRPIIFSVDELYCT